MFLNKLFDRNINPEKIIPEIYENNYLTFSGNRCLNLVLLHVNRCKNGVKEALLSAKGPMAVEKNTKPGSNYNEGILYDKLV